MLLPIGDNIERRTFPTVPVVLILANVAVFVVQLRMFAGDPPPAPEAVQEFYQTWGLVPQGLAQGQLLGLITHMFLHGDLMHILGNMVVLLAFACSLEVGLGRGTLLGFYFLFGVAGGLAHAAMNWSSDIPLIGASGAIAGLIGAYTVLYGPHSKIRALIFLCWRPFRVDIPAAAFGIGWVGLQLWSASNDVDGGAGIAWYAHLGGFLAGVGITWLCRHETECELVDDGYGNLEFVDPKQKERQAQIEQAYAAGDFWLPPECAFCGHELGEPNRLAANLARCGNPDCERMIYGEVVPAISAVGT